MKINVLIFLLFLCACSSHDLLSKNRRDISYNEVRDLVLSQSDEAKIIKKLGTPNEKTSDGNAYTLHYSDPKTSLPRLLVTLLADTNTVIDAIWIPRHDEAEYSLQGAKAAFADLNFKEVAEKKANPHSFSKGADLFIDEKSGVTIRYDKDHKATEAIGFYHSDSRTPAQQKPASAAPYSL